MTHSYAGRQASHHAAERGRASVIYQSAAVAATHAAADTNDAGPRIDRQDGGGGLDYCRVVRGFA